MTRRFLALGLAAAVLALGGLTARAGQVTLPSDLGTLETGGNFAIVAGDLEFSNFTYTGKNVATGDPVGPPASAVTVSEFTANPPGVPGLTFNGGFNVPPGSSYDYTIGYVVTALNGTKITEAFSSIVGGIFGGNGSVSVGETLTFAGGGTLGAPLESSIPGSPISRVSFDPQSQIFVSKDIAINGGDSGATLSIINQGFSTGVIPEPTSMALLGLGLTGLFTFRRFFKRAFVA